MQRLLPSQVMGAFKKAAILNVGPPKSGKTFCIWTLLELFNKVWYHDFDQGSSAFLTAAVANGIKPEELDRKVEIFRYGLGLERMSESKARKHYTQPTFDFIKQMNKPYDYIDSKTGLYTEKAVAEGLVPDLVIVDSLTNLQKELMDFVLNLNQHELGDKGTDARTDYGQVMDKITEAINTVKGLPCSFVLNCHEQIIQDETTGVIRSQPMVAGKDTLAQYIANYFDIVVYSFSENGKYEWWVKPQKYVRSAGTRFKVMPEARIEQDYRKIY